MIYMYIKIINKLLKKKKFVARINIVHDGMSVYCRYKTNIYTGSYR